MKNKILLLALLLLISISAFSTTWTINSVGNTFSPPVVIINVGDSVNFSIASIHNVLEVSQTTWNANGSTALAGGFSAPFGGGLILPAKLTVGTHYYVCVPHSGMGMKGSITVTPTTGIDEVSAKVSINIFPNPASDFIHISADSDLAGSDFSITNLKGQQMIQGIVTQNNQKTDISSLPSGVYLFIWNDQRRKAIRFVKD